MNIWHMILLVAGLGGVGGIVNCLITGEFTMPCFDKSARVWRPGWIGNMLVGSVASVVVWGIYGPLASYDLVHGNMDDSHLTVAQLLSSLVIGLSGGKILTLMAEKNAAKFKAGELADALDSITKKD